VNVSSVNHRGNVTGMERKSERKAKQNEMLQTAARTIITDGNKKTITLEYPI
jgi:hypothetical protein